jgi:CubicO group peptidase (beta-lactamase class C family)
MNIVTPESQGFSSQRLARIHATMQRYVEERKLAGIVTLIARRGEVVHFDQVGMADIEAGTPMAADTLFRIYSMTKPITSVAALMLFEEARVRLTDPVAQYIPAFSDVKVLDHAAGTGAQLVAPTRPITIRDLFTHTAGLSYGFDQNHIDALYRKHVWGAQEANPATTLEELVLAVARQPLVFQPGTRFRYSVATDVLGYLVQVIAGMPFDVFLRQRIFEPLGMVDTDFHVPPEKIMRFAANYGPAKQEGLSEIERLTGSADPGKRAGLKVIDPPKTSRYARPTAAPSGGGGLVSTTGDYLRFAQMLLNRGELDGVRLLGRKTVELMTTNHLPEGVHPSDDPAFGFGLGVNVLLDLGKAQTLGSVGNFGWGGAANTNFWVDPKEQLLGILMAQFMPNNTYPATADFRILAYQALTD